MASKDFWKGMVFMAGLAGIGAAAYFGGKKALDFVKEKQSYRFCDDDDFCWCEEDCNDEETNYVDSPCCCSDDDCDCGCECSCDENCDCSDDSEKE